MGNNFLVLGEYILKKTSHMSKAQQDKSIAFILHCLSMSSTLDGDDWERVYFEWMEANNGEIPDWRDTWNYERVYSND